MKDELFDLCVIVWATLSVTLTEQTSVSKPLLPSMPSFRPYSGKCVYTANSLCDLGNSKHKHQSRKRTRRHRGPTTRAQAYLQESSCPPGRSSADTCNDVNCALRAFWVTHRRNRSRMLSWSTLISCPTSKYFVIVASIRAGVTQGLRIACRRHVCVIVCMVGLCQYLELGARGDRLRCGNLLGVHLILPYTHAVFSGLSSVVIA